jgi:hypothetical protein
MQLFHAPVIGILGTDLTELHHVCPLYGKWIFKAVDIPTLKNGHIKTYMCSRKIIVVPDERKKRIEVADVIHYSWR